MQTPIRSIYKPVIIYAWITLLPSIIGKNCLLVYLKEDTRIYHFPGDTKGCRIARRVRRIFSRGWGLKFENHAENVATTQPAAE